MGTKNSAKNEITYNPGSVVRFEIAVGQVTQKF
jgi:hypothetical protein